MALVGLGVPAAGCGEDPEGSKGGGGTGSEGDSEAGATADETTDNAGATVVELHWEFEDPRQTCALSGVMRLEVELRGQPPLVVLCDDEQRSVRFTDVEPGLTGYEINAYDLSSRLLSWANASVEVEPMVVTRVDATLQHPTMAGSAEFVWTFGGSQSCGEAGVDSVEVRIDDRSIVLPCDHGSPPQRTLAAWLPPGSTPFTILGRRDGQTIARVDSTVSVANGETATVHVDLDLVDGQLGSALVSWYRCSVGGPGLMKISVDDNPAFFAPCFDAEYGTAARVDDLIAGSHSISVVGTPYQGYGATKFGGGVTVIAGEVAAVDLGGFAPSITKGHDWALHWTVDGAPCEEASFDQIVASVGVGGSEKALSCADRGQWGAWSVGSYYAGEYEWSIEATGAGGTRYAAQGARRTSDQMDTHLYVDLLPEPPADGPAAIELDIDFATLPCDDLPGLEGTIVLSSSEDELVAQAAFSCNALPMRFDDLAESAIYGVHIVANAGAHRFIASSMSVVAQRGSTSRYSFTAHPVPGQ